MVVSRYLVGRDGRTAFERRRGRPCRTPIACFGELVHYKELHADAKKDKFETDWRAGIWLGLAQETNETYVGTSMGIVKAYAIKRYPEDQRWNLEMMQGVVGTPRRPDPNRAGLDPPVRIRFDEKEDEITEVEVKENTKRGIPKRVGIKQKDLSLIHI